MSAIDLDGLKAWIGRTEEATDIVTPRLTAQYQATLTPHLAAAGSDEVAPGLHWCLAPPIAPTAELGPDGHPLRGGFLPPVPLPRRMWAGGALTFRRSIRVGDTVGRVSRIADVILKEGRTGSLCFVTVEHRVEVGGGVALEERQDIVYRGAEAGAPAKPPAPADGGSHRREIDVSAPLLFRYSALTFNGHRIHYDRRYAVEVEGYSGLVVHGPLQATLLLNFAAAIRELRAWLTDAP